MRVLVRLIAVVAGLVLAIVGAVFALEVLWSLARPGSDGLLVRWKPLRSTVETLSWDDTSVRVAAVVLVLAGIVFLLLAAGTGRTDIRLHDPAPGVAVTTDPRSLARLVGHHVRELDDVSTATVTANRHHIQVSASGRFTDAGQARGELTESVEESVRGLPLQRTPKVSVSVSRVKEHR